MRRFGIVAGALGVLAVLLAPAGARAQTQPPASKDAAVILILDASKSMRADDGTGRPKFQAAKAALNTLVDELPDDARVGLRVYGSEVSGTGREAGCADTKLVSPVEPLDRDALKSRIDALRPRGFTPIGASLRGAAEDLGTAKQKTIVLVSDGGDNCAPPEPCDVAREIGKGGIDLKIQAVGFQVTARARRQLQCIADAGGGRYVDAQDAQELGGQLRALTARALRPYLTQGRRLEPVGDPAGAKLYGAGQYTTEITPGQANWYSFKVGAGQSISVSGTLPNSPAGIPTIFRTEIQDESLESQDSGLATNSGDVLTVIAEADVEEDELRRPPNGRFFVLLEADPAAGQTKPYPIELLVRVTGTVVESKENPSGEPEPSGGASGEEQDGTSDLVLAAGGGIGILAGVLAGGAAAGIRRRRAA